MTAPTATATAPAGTAGRKVTVTLPDGRVITGGDKNGTHAVIGITEDYDSTTRGMVVRWTVIRVSKSADAAAKLAAKGGKVYADYPAVDDLRIVPIV